MKTHVLLSLSVLILIVSCRDQEPSPDTVTSAPTVYENATFPVNHISNIVYGTGLSHTSINSESSNSEVLELDVYFPENEDENRPAYVFIHGGGFVGGDKTQGSIVSLAEYYASRGWVFYSINYRLKDDYGTIPQAWLDYTSLLEEEFQGQFMAIYPAQRDAKAAMRWVVANASSFNINTEYITVGGGSAGAITAITVGISEPEDFRDELALAEDPTLETTNLNEEYSVKTIIDLWGSKIALDGLEEVFGHDRFDAEDPPMLIVHGTEDPTVLFTNAEDLKSIYEMLNIPLAYYPIEGGGHGIWGATVDGKGIDELSFDFIVEQQELVIEN